MHLDRTVDVPIYDLSLVRGIWEGRVKKYSQKQRKEKERVEKSALNKINQQWHYRIYCKTLKKNETNLLHHYLERSTLTDIQPYQDPENPGPEPEAPEDQSRFIFQLDGDKWTDFPNELQWMTHLKEWHIMKTKICRLPDYLAMFTELTVLEIPKNVITELPAEIGTLTQLKELNVNYNHLSRVPPELGNCENLERLELTGNNNLSELPFELSSLKKLVHLDIAENRFASIPICALRMTSLELLDMSNNVLTDLPEDMDRLEQLHSLFVHKNGLSYLPHCLCNIATLKMIVVSGEELTCIPTHLCSNPDIKFIRLYDNPASEERNEKEAEEKKKSKKPEKITKDSNEKEFMQAYVECLKDRDTVPYSTTKVSISLLL